MHFIPFADFVLIKPRLEIQTLIDQYLDQLEDVILSEMNQ